MNTTIFFLSMGLLIQPIQGVETIKEEKLVLIPRKQSNHIYSVIVSDPSYYRLVETSV
jgi:hypothetical protein